MMRAAFSSGLPIIVAANIESRKASILSMWETPLSRYSEWMSDRISFRKGPWMSPPSLQILDIIFSSSSTTWKSSLISFGSVTNLIRSAVDRSADLGSVPEMGFISTTSPVNVRWRSGEDPMKYAPPSKRQKFT